MKKRLRYSARPILSLLLAVAMLLGMVPGTLLTAIAAEEEKTYTQDFAHSGGGALRQTVTEDKGTVAVVNQDSWELTGKGLLLKANNADLRTKLMTFSDSVDSSTEGLADGIYEVAFRTLDKTPGSLGFLARYKDEQNYAGLSIDNGIGGAGWTAHYSTTGAPPRGNVPLTTDQPGNLKPNTSYQAKITYEGAEIAFAYKEEAATEYTDLGAVTLPEATAYLGEGGFAIRLNAGLEDMSDGKGGGGDAVLLDNIQQKKLDGTLVKELDFEADDVAPVCELRTNKGTVTLEPSKVTLTLEDIPAGEAVAGFGKSEQTNKLVSVAGGLFMDVNVPSLKIDKGIYTVKFSSSDPRVGVAFRHKDPNNYATIEYDGTKWIAGGMNAGTAISIDLSAKSIPALTANTIYIMALDYTNPADYKLTINDTEYALGALESICTGGGRVGVVAGAAATIYAGAVELSYTETTVDPPEPPVGPTDPGLPEALAPEGFDVYTQDSSKSTSTIVDGANSAVPAVNVNQETWGMDGKSLLLTSSGSDYRTKLLPLGGDTSEHTGPADGSYEFTFHTGETVPLSLGFLARYKDESSYAGISMDGGAWVAHCSIGLSGRTNTSLKTQPGALQPNTTYKMEITHAGTAISYAYMKEGDTEYTQLGAVTLGGTGYIGAGGFAVRLKPGNASITLDNIIQRGADKTTLMTLDFNDGVAPTQETRANKANNVITSGATLALKDIPASTTVNGFTPGRASVMTATAAAVFIDSTSPVTSTGNYTVQVSGTGTQSGLAFHYKDAGNYATIEYDGTKWIAGGMNAGRAISIDLSAENIPAPEAGKTRTLRLDSTDAANYKLTLSGATREDAVTYELGDLAGICTEAGKVGLVAGEAMTLYAGTISVLYPLKPTEVPDPTEDFIVIKSAEMQVLVGETFPHIYSYKSADGATALANGVRPGKEQTGMSIVTTLGVAPVPCTTTSVKKTSTENSVTYEVTATGTGVAATFTVVLTVTGKTLRMEVTDVVQTTGAVRTFAFVNQPMLSLAGLGVGAAMGRVNSWGPAKDVFVQVKGAAQNASYNNVTYALLYDKAGGSVAAAENNAENGADKYTVLQQVGADAQISLSNNAWAWQYYDAIDPLGEGKPYATVVIGGDENADGAITWQDAGVAYRQIMRKPFGGENTKNEWMYIAMNMSSQVSQPFVRVLDQAKAVSYLTDGFGMKIMNKGYQAGGHDDSHGDYKFIGTQQGGAKEFNYLIDEGLKYGIKNGVHINATEFALDGFTTELNNMTRKPGGELSRNWNWFDQAYLVDKTKDVTTGALKARLADFETAAPNLDFAYVDVYQAGSRYNASQLMKYLNGNGLTVGSEALGDFNQDISFVHWNTDLYYPVGGSQSQVMRFVANGVSDIGAPDRALLGALMPGNADWRNTNNFDDAQITFYRNNLPTKYLQHFNLMSWTPDEAATFSDNVQSIVTTEAGVTYTSIYKDEKLVAKLNTTKVRLFEEYAAGGNPGRPSGAEIFLPWSPEVEDKIYCYSDMGGAKEWSVPDSWADGTAYLYTLTNSGRADVQTVAVTRGNLTLNLIAGTPYVLTKTQATQPHLYHADGAAKADLIPAPTGDHAWGEGSLIRNFGFTDQTLNGWTVTAETGTAADASIDLSFHGKDPRVGFQAGFTGDLSQEMSVKAGKTYSFSAWVNAEGARPVTLTVTAGEKTATRSIDTTAGIPVAIKPSKYTGLNYQRLKVDITIPTGVTTATLCLSTVAGDQMVYADDFRSWEWTGTPNPLTETHYYYEDFENLDENWGPFVSQVSGQPYIHLAYKNPNGGQIKYYTVDTLNTAGQPDGSNLTSLKGQQTGQLGTDRTVMRTLPSTVDFEAGSTYEVKFDHQTYRELRSSDDEKVDTDSGYNSPLPTDAYKVDVRKANGTLIESYPLKRSTFTETEGNYSYNSRPSTETASFSVDATTEPGIYLTVSLILPIQVRNIFSIDNFRVTQTVNTQPHNIAVAPLTGGTVTANPTTAAQGATVTLTVVGNEGFTYREDSLTAAYGDGRKAALTTVSEGVYSFVMPAGDVSVSAGFKSETGYDPSLILRSTFDFADRTDTKINDREGENNQGTIGGTVTFEAGVRGDAVKIYNKAKEAVNHVDYGTAFDALMGTGNFSIAFWVKSEGTETNDSAIMGNKDYNNGANKGIAIPYFKPGDIRVNFGSGTGRVDSKENGGQDMMWHHFAVTVDRTGFMTTYVDGVQTARNIMTTLNGKEATTGLPFVLGGDGNKTWSANSTLDELRIYSSAVGADVISAVYTLEGATLETKNMRTQVEAMTPSARFPAGSIAAMLTKLTDAAAALVSASDKDTLALMNALRAEYATFLEGTQPLAKFHVVADVHVVGDNVTKENLIKGMQDMKRVAPDAIAMVNAGDFTESGTEAQFEQFYDAIKTDSPVAPGGVLNALGNHDVRGNPWIKDPADPRLLPGWAIVKNRYLTLNAPYMPPTEQVYFSRELGGYTFITLNTELGLKDTIYMTDAQLDWFEAEMKKAYEADPTKPIFITAHQALNNSHQLTDTFTFCYPERDEDARVKEIMQKYPTGIFMSGHLHNGFGAGGDMHRSYGVALDLPSFAKPEGRGYSQKGAGYVVYVYEDEVIYRARNFMTAQWLPQYDISLPIPSLPVTYQTAKSMVDNADCSTALLSAVNTAIEPATDMLAEKNSWEYYLEAGRRETLTAQAVSLVKAMEHNTITFANGGGTGALPRTMLVEKAEAITLPSSSLTYGSYTFGGWNDGTALYQAGSTYTTTDADVTFTAQWVHEIPPYNPPTDNTTTETAENKDGSTTKTVTNKRTGEIVATTTHKDGTKIITTIPKEGDPTAKIALPAGKGKTAVTVPLANTKPSTVAYLVHADGTEELIKLSIATQDGVKVLVEGNVTLKLRDNAKHFGDVKPEQWHADAVTFATSRELFQGVSMDAFAPNQSMTRAMLTTVLHRLSGEKRAEGDAWYSASVDWAKEQGISDGSAPEAKITRESLAVMLYRYAKGEKVETDLTIFSDAANVSAWAEEAMNWAVKTGIISGKSGNLDPNGDASRAEVATMLMRFVAAL